MEKTKIVDTELEFHEFKQLLHPKARQLLTPEAYEILKNAEKDPENLEIIKDNFVTYSSVLAEPGSRIRIKTYISAIKFVSMRMLGRSIIEAYKATFPEKVERIMKGATERGIPLDDYERRDSAIGIYANAFNRTKIVTRIMTQTIVPTWVLNAPLYQKAINKLAYLMEQGKSERIQMESAAKLVEKLQPPEEGTVKLDISFKDEENVIDRIQNATQELIIAQKKAMESGAATTKQIASSSIKVIDVEPE